MTWNFLVYIIGYALVVAGVAYGMHAYGIGREWITAVVLVMAGLGLVYAFARSQEDVQTRDAERREGRRGER